MSARNSRTDGSTARPAVFYDGDGTHQSDTCEAVKQAITRGDIRLHALVRPPYPGRAMPRGAPAGLRSVGCWDARGRQRWGLDWHRNEGVEVTWVRSGSCPFDVGAGPTDLDHRRFAVTQPWRRHRLGDPHVRPSRLGWIILDVGVQRPNQRWQWPDWLLLSPDQRRRIEGELRHDERHVWNVTPDLRVALDQLDRRLEALPESGLANERLALLVSQIFSAIADLMARQAPRTLHSCRSSESTVRVFLDELPRHVAHPWSVPEMARACGLGVSQFTAICRRLRNLSPNELLVHVRLQEAARLLADSPHVSITHVALCCGFGSSQYLAYQFRKHLGTTPTARRGRSSAATDTVASNAPA